MAVAETGTVTVTVAVAAVSVSGPAVVEKNVMAAVIAMRTGKGKISWT